MIQNFHIFDGDGNCLFSLNKEEEESNKLLYGFVYSLKSFSERLTPIVLRDNNFITYSTNSYQLVFYEFPTSIKFVLIVSLDNAKTNDYYKQVLRDLYRTVYVEYVVKNPACKCKSIIDSLLFREKLIEFFNRI